MQTNFIRALFGRVLRRLYRSPLLSCMQTFAIVSLCSVQVMAGEITVFAAASLTDALREIGKEFEKEKGVIVHFSFGASSILARQIQEGGRADIFFSADEEKMALLSKAKLLDESRRRGILENTLVIVTPEKSPFPISSPNDLLKCKRLALAETRTVPAGIYARQFLEREKLWRELESRVINAENVRAALAAVESGNVEAGIVYKTDAAISKHVQVAYEIQGSSAPQISYPAAVLAEARNSKGAEEFFNYLQSKKSVQVFEKFGFLVKGVE
ncbi:MAG: molybdate ABC transporter substrate-binding protein [Verrucomicrobiota bacterium]|nr:molybdate ABC transporter substrate-binding protein [Verrucomicrobiota bacterium]